MVVDYGRRMSGLVRRLGGQVRGMGGYVVARQCTWQAVFKIRLT